MALQTIQPYIVVGRNIFDYERDVCTILDACRYDLSEEVIAEYPGLDELRYVECASSLASAIPEWAPRTSKGAPEGELLRTAHVPAKCGLTATTRKTRGRRQRQGVHEHTDPAGARHRPGDHLHPRRYRR